MHVNVDEQGSSIVEVPCDGSDDGDDVQLPDHCRSMRKAATFCIKSLSSGLSLSFMSAVSRETLESLKDNYDFLPDRRQKEHSKFWENVAPENSSPSPATDQFFLKVRMKDIPTTTSFRRQFHDCNIPCLIVDGLDEDRHQTTSLDGSCFHRVSREWRNFRGESESDVNRGWFVEKLGEDSQVPLRVQPTCQSPLQSSFDKDQINGSTLDDDGRAEECETKVVTLKEWIQMLQDAELSHSDSHGEGLNEVTYYLKDWHFQSEISQKKKRLQASDNACESPCDSLYDVPSIFGFDLLNSFLIRFTNGDYRFVYWGPKNSFTSRHSDVLHSFSWSYNVVGTKRWTFFEGHSDRHFSVVQSAGQAMFVPSTWQHHVVNLEETVSINHNWITTANLDMCWSCLDTEIRVINKELDEWGIDDLEAHESMLRGCVGLDVTAFFLMILVRLAELLVEKNSEEIESGDITSDLLRLTQMIRHLRNDEPLQLGRRLESVLRSKPTVVDLLKITDGLLDENLLT